MRLKTFYILEADCLSNARRLARRQLRRLFIDDDPEQLILAFDPAERDADTLRTLAACIVLTGRPRLQPL